MKTSMWCILGVHYCFRATFGRTTPSALCVPPSGGSVWESWTGAALPLCCRQPCWALWLLAAALELGRAVGWERKGTHSHWCVWEPSHVDQWASERCAGRNVEAITLRAVFWAIPKETSDPVFMKPIASGPNEAIKQRVLCVWSKCGNFYKNIAEW